MGLREVWNKSIRRIKGGAAERVMMGHLNKVVSKVNENSPTVREPNPPYEMNRKIMAENGGVSSNGIISIGKIVIDLAQYPAARAIEFGSGDHDINSPGKIGFGTRPDGPEDQMLRFKWAKIGGRWFVGPHVEHPGREAKPYIKPSIEETSNILFSALGKFMDQEIRVSFKEENAAEKSRSGN